MDNEVTRYIPREDIKAAKLLAEQGAEAIKEAEESGDIALKARAQLARTFFKGSKPDNARDPEIITGEGNVVVIEDEKVLLKMTRRLLTCSGYKVETFASAKDALSFFNEDSYRESFTPDEVDLVISDIMMPGMDGTQLVMEINEIKPGIKVLFVSGSTASEHNIDETKQPFLQKPFKHYELAAMVKRIIENKEG
jgi:CheY-like chemotaxis protein